MTCEISREVGVSIPVGERSGEAGFRTETEFPGRGSGKDRGALEFWPSPGHDSVIEEETPESGFSRSFPELLAAWGVYWKYAEHLCSDVRQGKEDWPRWNRVFQRDFFTILTRG